MIYPLSIISPYIIAHLLYALPFGHTGERLRRIIFVPPVCTEQVNDFFAFPCAVQLGIDSPADFPSASEAILQTCYRSRLCIPCHILAKDIVGRTIWISVGCYRHIPVYVPVFGHERRDTLSLGFGPSSATAANCKIKRILHRQPVAVPDMLECEIWLEIVVLAEIECFAVTIAPIPAVTAAVFVNVTGAEPRGALFMAFRGAQCGEYQVMSGPEFFRDVKHIRI
ncbi:unknown [Bacteroides sp. CAG:770]|nr:unknown [Bacteroides sp. CAG:770]